MVSQYFCNNLKKVLLFLAVVTIGCKPLDYTKSISKGNTDKIIITGQVFDRETGLVMPVVSISTINKLSRTSTDKDGKYVPHVTKSSKKLKVGWIGYNHIYTRNLKLKQGDSAVINFKMREDRRPIID